MADQLVQCSKPHIVMFPFMSKGHIIPLLHLSELLFRRGVLVTIFTTPGNRPFIADALNGTNVSVVELPFPENIPEIPSGVESTDKLPSMSLLFPFIKGMELMQPSFEEALENIHSEVDCIISDGFLHWTLQSAARFGIPRLSFYGMNTYAMTIMRIASSNGLITMHESADEPFSVTGFPSVQITRNHFSEPFNKLEYWKSSLNSGIMWEMHIATAKSYGMLVNNFYELEKDFADYWNREYSPKTWYVGPLCLAHQKMSLVDSNKPKWISWLDEKLVENRPVLYVAFGSQAKISPEQLYEMAMGLEESRVSFLWVVGKNATGLELLDEFEERVKKRAIVVKEWVDQNEILEHEAIRGFLSHCGWNSVLEGICAEVPILAWPMMAEQWLNAKMVVEEIRVGLGVTTVDGSAKGFVNRESLRDSVIDLMEGKKGIALREKVKEVADAAKNAMAEGGSSWNNLDELIKDVREQKKINSSKITNGTWHKSMRIQFNTSSIPS